jgi:hypothetical protein
MIIEPRKAEDFSPHALAYLIREFERRMVNHAVDKGTLTLNDIIDCAANSAWSEKQFFADDLKARDFEQDSVIKHMVLGLVSSRIAARLYACESDGGR